MAPTRVGIIGLSAKEPVLGPGSWAAVAILPAFRNNPAFEIVALCNSSVEAAQRSIEFHKLPSSTKAYSDAAQIAEDPDVDLVVVSVVVSTHLKLTLPALKAKKKVYVEWPLGANTREAEEMTQLAEANNLKTILGLQGRGNPIVKKARELVKAGEIGEITNTSVVAALPQFGGGNFWFEGVEMYLDVHYGGNNFRITFAHFLDSFVNVVGEFDLDSLSSVIQRDSDTIEVRKWDMVTVVNPAHPKTAPDHILVQGKLKNRGAPASISFRSSRATIEDVGVRWIITGTKGEIEITADRNQWQIESGSKKLKLKLFESGEVREYDMPSADLGVASNLADSAVNTALIVDGFAKGTEGSYADFASALKMHKLLDTILERSGYLSTL